MINNSTQHFNQAYTCQQICKYIFINTAACQCSCTQHSERRKLNCQLREDTILRVSTLTCQYIGRHHSEGQYTYLSVHRKTPFRGSAHLLVSTPENTILRVSTLTYQYTGRHHSEGQYTYLSNTQEDTILRVSTLTCQHTGRHHSEGQYTYLSIQW